MKNPFDKKKNSSLNKLRFFNMISHFFQIGIIFSFFQVNLCVTFTNPKSLTLITGDILIIHQNGIDVYDSSLTNLIQNAKTFSSNEKINDQNTLSKVSVSKFGQNEKNVIISIIINKIYIFNYKGEKLYEEVNTNIINIFTFDYYDLTPLKINGNKYTFSIGFVNSEGKVCLYIFEYNKDTNLNSLLKTLDPFQPKISSTSYSIANKGLACEAMSYSEKEDILVCFFAFNQNSQHKITTKLIDIINDYAFIDSENKYLEIYDPKIIKSAVTSDGKKALICASTPEGTSFCSDYTINDNSFTEKTNYGVICRDGHYSSNVEYMRETNQFIFSCSSNSGDLTAQIFDENLEPVGTVMTIFNGDSVSGASIIYSYDLGNYYVISDVSSSNDDTKKFISFPSGTVTSIFVEKFELFPTTISTTIPTTILTTIPTTILTTIPTTILTSVITTILTTLPTMIPTNLMTTVPEKALTSMPTTIKEEMTFKCNLDKCSVCNKESFINELCIECNNKKNYYQISPLITYNSLADSKGYIDCYNNNTKPPNFYFNKKTEYYEPCYTTCATCEHGGNGNEHNCTTCDVDHIFEPEKKNSTNCVVKCTYYYYISYGQYKCTISPQCPEDINLLIRERRKCVENCSEDPKYIYQYNGECIENCPNDTIKDEKEHICKVKITESCTQSSATFELYDFLKQGGVEKIAKNYASEFNYTNKHIALLKNEVYSIMLYKEKECISELNLPMPEIDFGDCYKNVQLKFGLENKDLIIGIIDKKSNKKSNPITSYAFYNPENGDKLDSEEACKEEVIVVQENIKSLLNDSSSDIDSILYLAGQNIDVFNISSEFYTSLCYHFDSPCDKDVALKDRLLIYYPNITLCDSGCKNTGVNLTSMMAIYECKFKEITDEEDYDDNVYEVVVYQFNEILNQVNFAVMGCYKDLFKYKYFSSNTGGIIFLLFIIAQIVTLIIYYFSSLFVVSKYIYNIADNYILYLNKSQMVNDRAINFKNKNETNKNNNEQNKNYPPKKVNSSKTDKSDIEQLHNKSYNNMSPKGKVLKTQEDIKHNKMLNNEQFKKPKKLIRKIKSFSNKNLKKNEIRLKTNSHSFSKDRLTFEDYLSTEFDDMHFHDVVITDRRLFFDYLCDKLKKKQLILQLFFANSLFKPITIKILLLVLDIEICFVVNAMFINENYVSKLFHSTKEEKFISFISRSINRSILTILTFVVVNYFMECLFVEESKMKGILKREKHNMAIIKYEINILIKEVKIRNNIFIIIAFAFSAFSWFYISCFNYIYPHMKSEWIKSSVFIIILIHFLSVFVILIEALLRFVSFEIKSERMYRASIWLG